MAEPSKASLLKKIDALEREILNSSEFENKWHEAEATIIERDKEISRLQNLTKKLEQTILQLQAVVDNYKNIIDNQVIELKEFKARNESLAKELSQTFNSLQLVTQQNSQYISQEDTIKYLSKQIEEMSIKIGKYRNFLAQLIQPLSSFQEFNGEVLDTIQNLLN